MLQKRVQKLLSADSDISACKDVIHALHIPSESLSQYPDLHFAVRDAYEASVSARLIHMCASLEPLAHSLESIASLTETIDAATTKAQTEISMRPRISQALDIFDLEVSLDIAEKFTSLFRTSEAGSSSRRVREISGVIGNGRKLLELCGQQVYGVELLREQAENLDLNLERMRSEILAGKNPEEISDSLDLLRTHRPQQYELTVQEISARRAAGHRKFHVKNIVTLAELAEKLFSLAEEERKFWGVHSSGVEAVLRQVWSEIVWEEISDSPVELIRASKILAFMQAQEIFPPDVAEQLEGLSEEQASLSLNRVFREISDPSFFLEEAVRLELSARWFELFVDAMEQFLGRAQSGNLDKISSINFWSNAQLPMQRAATATHAVHRVAAMIDLVMTEIVSEISHEILSRHNIAEKLLLARKGEPLDAVTLSLSLRSFCAALVATGHSLGVAHKAIDRLNSKERRSEARQGVAAALLQAYAEMQPHAVALGVAEYSLDEVRTLLDL